MESNTFRIIWFFFKPYQLQVVVLLVLSLVVGALEAAVQKAIDEISRDHTVIIVAHRLSTIANADKIIVLGNGKVLEEGTHEELIARRGAYWELYRSQPV